MSDFAHPRGDEALLAPHSPFLDILLAHGPTYRGQPLPPMLTLELKQLIVRYGSEHHARVAPAPK